MTDSVQTKTAPAQALKSEEFIAGTPIKRPMFIAMIAMLMALNALAIDVILPAFPAMLDTFGQDIGNKVQYVLSAYLIGFGIAQLFYGPVTDRFGRRAPLFFGMALYIIFAFAAVFAPSFEMLLFCRVMQGVGAASTRVIAVAVVRDTHSGRAMASTMSLVMMVFMVVPIFAPMIGQGIIIFGDWHLIFLFMAAICAVVLVWAALKMPETLPVEKRRELTLKSVLISFKLIITNRLAFFYALATAFFFGGLFGFLNVAQPIYGDVYGLGSWFPIAFGSVAVLMAISSFANSKLVGTFGQRRLAHSALLAFFGAAVLLVVSSIGGNPPFWVFMSILALAMPLFGLIGANLNSLAMEPLGAVAGTASSVLGFMQTVGGALVGATIGQYYSGQVLDLATGFALVSGIAIVFVLVAEKGLLFGTAADIQRG
ncbi:multidrug effflux MFS transporter [Ahrensia sp. 13_GOM-1096m]|uniref:multidrug effflux MFS transporter n=1 Tax=Ahrensia sp. 13_GOM-1096m TaxID=1380380 RepID=UPI000A535936|nr:multidrug effflux MFS transporter [Ahrensia sp. 13_GOM-1096m]